MKLQNMPPVFLLVIALLFPTVASASDSYTVANGTYQNITAFSECKRITNNSGHSLYVPAVNSGEWSNFYGISHTNVQVAACPQEIVDSGEWSSVGSVSCTGGRTITTARGNLTSNSHQTVCSYTSGNCDHDRTDCYGLQTCSWSYAPDLNWYSMYIICN